jgi:hypothetical protein
MLYRLITFMLLVAFVGAANTPGRQTIKDDTEKERAKRAADHLPNSAKDEPATKLEKFMARKNVLIVKDAYSVGSVPGQQGSEVKVEAVVVSAVGEVTKIYGLSLIRFANRASVGERLSAKEAVSFVDFDEIASLQNALEYVSKIATEASPETPGAGRPPASNDSRADEDGPANSSTEFSLLTRGGLKAGMLQLGRQQTGFIQFNTAAQEVAVFFGIGALGRFRNLVSQARTRLVALGAR